MAAHLAAMNPSRRARRLLPLLVAALLAIVVAPASASLNVTSFTGSVIQADGSPATQAASHPYAATTTIEVAEHQGPLSALPDESLKDIHVTLPAGFTGDPLATPRCTERDLNDLRSGGPGCPASTQVGVLFMNLGLGAYSADPTPIYNIVPPPGAPAVFALNISSNIVRLVASVRTGGDYGLSIDVKNTAQYNGLVGSRLTFWGVPADPRHDAERFFPDPHGAHQGAASEARLKPLLTNPMNCTAGLLTTGLRANSWEDPDVFATASFDHDVDGEPMHVDGCDQVPFDPSITVRPASHAAHTPTGLAVELKVPQNADPTGLASATLKKAVVRLPEGMTVSPSAADGLGACAPEQIGLTNAEAPACPDSSKIGTVEVETPVLEAPLHGSVYLAKQGDNPFRSLLALYIAAHGSGVTVKLPGKVEADPVTGQLTATFDNNPQLPFSDLKLEFDGGARASLVSPATCGTRTTTAELTSWSGKTVNLSDSFTIDQGCDQAGRFEPTMDAGVTNTTAGGSSSFVLNLARPDGQQTISALDVTLPAGVLAHVGSVPLCPDAQAAAGTCSAASQVGRTTVAAGPGSLPLSVPQPGKTPTAVYLAGPYKGAPYSLSIVVPAQAGPFDLGTVVVRAALFVDPVDAHVIVRSDPLPTILQGIPLDVRQISVTMDRPAFMVSPTNCDPMQVTAQVRSLQGATADVASRFQVGECAALDLKPKLAMSLTGKGQTTDNKHPGLTASLTMPGGGANLKTMEVTLPLSMALDPDNSQSDALCEFLPGQKTIPECPASSIVGNATATTPLLNVPLTGPVYFIKNVRTDAKTGRQIKTLPTLAVVLQGSGITLVLRASSAVPDGKHLVTTFDQIPDAPVSDFTLNINGGSKGILVVSRANLCAATQIATQVAGGQNGKVDDADITLGTPCALGIAASSHTASRLKVTVGGIGAGKVSVSGAGLSKTTRTIGSATAATLQPRLSKVARSALAHHRNVKVRVTVSFTPKGAKKAKTARKTITIHGAKKK